MARPNVFKVRLTDEELSWLATYAKTKQLTNAEALRQCVQSMKPNVQPAGQSLQAVKG